jgi:hypothetical protein
MKISTQTKLISTALLAAAIAAPIAYGGSGTYPQLRTGEGFSFKAPSYWNTTQRPHVRMNRSLEVPPQYLSPETLTPLRTPREAINRSLGVPPQYLGRAGLRGVGEEQVIPVVTGSGFDWGDAGIGAAFVAGLGILGCCGFLAVRRRHELAQLDV